MCKTKWFLVVTMAAVMMMAGWVNAEGIISINFSENDGNQGFVGGEMIGPLKTDSANWNNTTGDRDVGTALESGTISNLKDDTGALTGASVEWQSSNTWWNSDATADDEHKMAVGYLDDGDTGGGDGVTITITNIPYAAYRVYGLVVSDQDVGPTYTTMNVDVNGEWVFGGDATTTTTAHNAINDNNTTHGEWWTEIVPDVVTGNYWTIETSGATCTITGQIRNGPERCSITAVIIERTAVAGLLAGNPDPPDDPDLVLPEVPTNKTMGWDIAEDPNDGNYGVGPDPSIAGHHIYLTTDKAALKAIPAGVTTDPNIYRGYNLRNVTTYTPGVYDENNNPLGLDTDKVYHWRIDERAEYPVSGVDPNTWKGNIWTFQTTKLLPVIDGQPQDTAEFLGDPAELSVSVTSATTESYQWKKVDPPGDVGTDSPTLSFASATVGDEGQYYCEITNNAGTVPSDPAWLDVKRLVGRWQFNGDLLDSASAGSGLYGVFDPGAGYGGSSTDPNYSSKPEDAIEGSNSIEFYSDVTAHIQIYGTETDQFNFHKRSGVTVNAWVKSTKASGWGAVAARQDKTSGNKGWILNTTPADGVMTIREAHNDIVGSTDVNDGEWHLVTGTYDPATGRSDIYIDGRPENGWVDTSDLSDVSQPIVFGAETAAGDVPFDGFVDDARLYNYVLSAFDIAYLYTTIMQDVMICPEPITYDFDASGTSYCIQDVMDLAEFLRFWLECNKVGFDGCYTLDRPID